MPFLRFFFADQETRSLPLSKNSSIRDRKSAGAQTIGSLSDGFSRLKFS
jgi:hypothetical protein